MNSPGEGADAGREHRTVTRVISILEAAAAAAPGAVTLADLAAALEAPKSSIHGFAQGLVATGYLVGDGGGYRIGPAAALLARPRLSVAEAARPAMTRLRDRFGESVTLAELAGRSYVYVASVESAQAIRYVPTARRRPLYPSSPGKVFLAAMPETRRLGYLRAGLAEQDAVRAAQEDLAEVRRRGIAFNRGETIPDVTGAAVPIVHGDTVIAALGVAGPTSRMSGKLDEIAEAIREAATEIAGLLRSP